MQPQTIREAMPRRPEAFLQPYLSFAKKPSMLSLALLVALQLPTTTKEWEDIARDFGNYHQFYNTLGAIDGKHIAITKPTNSGSMYFNYKGFYSIVVLYC